MMAAFRSRILNQLANLHTRVQVFVPPTPSVKPDVPKVFEDTPMPDVSAEPTADNPQEPAPSQAIITDQSLGFTAEPLDSSSFQRDIKTYIDTTVDAKVEAKVAEKVEKAKDELRHALKEDFSTFSHGLIVAIKEGEDRRLIEEEERLNAEADRQTRLETRRKLEEDLRKQQEEEEKEERRIKEERERIQREKRDALVDKFMKITTQSLSKLTKATGSPSHKNADSDSSTTKK